MFKVYFEWGLIANCHATSWITYFPRRMRVSLQKKMCRKLKCGNQQLKMNVSLEDIKNVKQKYCLGKSLKFFLAATWCDISQGPQLFLYILRQTEENQKRYIRAFHKRFIGRSGYRDGKQHHLMNGVEGGWGQGGDELQKHFIKYPLKWGEGNCRQFLDPRSLAYVAVVLHSYSIV